MAKLKFTLEKKSKPAPGGCVLWTGCCAKRQATGRPAFGYVRIVQGGKGKTFSVHRLAYTFAYGDPGKLHVLHSCDNPICINPKHLRAGTHQENMQDMVDRDRHATKIPRSDLPRIKALLELGVPQTIVAQAWGVVDSTISLLKKRAYFKKYMQPQAAIKGEK